MSYFLNESVLFEQQNAQVASVFHKIDIYNGRNDKWLAEGKYNEILFTDPEKQAITDMIKLIEQQLILNYYNELNEGIGDKFKSSIDKIKNLPANIKTAYEFCEKIINKGVSKVSELIKFFIELLQKLADTVREAIMKLGGFGKSAIKESSDDDPYSQYGEDEKKFLQCVEEYVSKRQDNKELLNEGAFDKFAEKVQNNKFLQVILCGTYKGEKLSWWKSLLVSITGSVIINVGVGVLCAVAGIAAQPLTAIVLAIWSLRSILRVILNRKSQMKKTGEAKFWNVAVVLQILFTVGTFIFFQIPCVKEFIANLVSSIVNNTAEFVQAKVNYLIEHFAGKQPNVDDIQNALADKAADAAADTASKVVDDTTLSQNVEGFEDKVLEFIKDGELTQKMRANGRAWSDKIEQLFPVTDNNPADSAFINASGFKDVGGGFHAGGGGKAGFIEAMAEKGLKAEFCDRQGVGGWIVQRLDGSNITGADEEAMNAITKTFAEAGGLRSYSPAHLLHITGDAIPEPPVVGPEDIVTPPAPGFDATPYFGGFAFVSAFRKENFVNKIKISFGSEAAANKFFKVSKIDELPLESINKELNVLGDRANKEGVDQVIIKSKQDKEYSNELAKITIGKDIKEAEGDNKPAEELDNIIKVNNSADPNKDKCLVFYTKIDNNGKDVELPIVAINYRTMYAVDLIKSKQLKTRTNPYFLKGLFNHLTVKPIDSADKDTQSELYKLLTKVLIGSAKGNAILCQQTIGQVKHLMKKDEWQAKAKDNDTPRLELGNFTNNEICDILNNPNDAFKYFNGEYASEITKTDDKGNVKNAKKREDIIEDKVEYVKNRFIPVITCKDTNVFKALAANKEVSKFFMKDGDWKKDDNGNLIILQKDIVDSIMRSPETFQEETNISLKDYLKGIFSKDIKDKNKAKEFTSAIHMLSAIIWDYAGDLSKWQKEVKIANKTANKKISEEKPVEVKVDDTTKTKANEIANTTAEKKEESKKEFNDATEWFNEEILPKLTKDSDTYKEISSTKILKKRYIKSNGDLDTKAIKDKYLIAALFANKEDFSKHIPLSAWKRIQQTIEKSTKKSKEQNKKIAKLRVKRIKLLYNAIAKQMLSSDNKKSVNDSYDFNINLK